MNIDTTITYTLTREEVEKIVKDHVEKEVGKLNDSTLINWKIQEGSRHSSWNDEYVPTQVLSLDVVVKYKK